MTNLRRTSPTCLALTIALAIVLSTALPQPGEASLLTKLVQEAGDFAEDGAGRAARTGAVGLDEAAAALARLPGDARGSSVAAAAMDNGHWRLVNSAGETVTAANAAELENALKWLAPEAADLASRPVNFHLSLQTVLERADRLRELPGDARLHVVIRGRSHPLVIAADGTRHARLRDNLLVQLSNADAVDEAFWQLRRPVSRGSVRVLTLESGAPGRLPAVRPGEAGAPVRAEKVDPYRFTTSVSGLKGQTVVVSGRADGELLRFTPAGARQQSILLADLRAAAVAADVNLVIIDAASPLQPGVRNMLWQRAEVAGLREALDKLTMADFFGALGFDGHPIVVSIEQTGASHVRLTARPREELASRLPDDGGSVLPLDLSEFLLGVVSNIAGDVATVAIEAAMRSKAHEEELRKRIVPGISSDYQYVYLALMALGLFGLPMALSWWRALWPPAGDAGNTSTPRLVVVGALRIMLFTLVFLPLVAVLATPAQFIKAAWDFVTAPFRWYLRRTA